MSKRCIRPADTGGGRGGGLSCSVVLILASQGTVPLDPQDMDFDTWQRQNRGIETNGTNVPDHVQQQVYALVNKAGRSLDRVRRKRT